MLEPLINCFRIPELRRKILFTLMMLALFRMGAFVPVPGVDTSVVKAAVDYNCDGAVLSYTPTCRALYVNQMEIQNTLMEELGAPSILLESDMVDPSSFNEAQTMSRIDAFIEVVKEKAKQREWLPEE